jgi:membrane-associated phospholipid phosphatase
MAIRPDSVLSRQAGLHTSSEGIAGHSVSLRLLQLNWIVVAVILAVLATSLLLTDFQLQISSYLVMIGIAAMYGLIGYLNARSRRSSNPQIYFTFFNLSQMTLLALLLTSLGHVVASANLPMQDARLFAFDRALGLDFRAYLDFFNSRPRLIHAFTIAYGSIVWQNLFVVTFLPLIGFHRRAAEFILGFAIALIATTIISTLLPATGVYGTLGLKPEEFPNVVPICYYATLHELPLLRDGTTRLLDAFQLAPILTFPSFHAISAVLYGWAFWPIRWLRWVGLLLNACMAVSTPIGGGHYFADVFAGLMIAALSIYAVKRIAALIARSMDDPASLSSPRLLAAVSIVS